MAEFYRRDGMQDPFALTTKLNYPHIGMFVFAWFIGLLIVPYLVSIAKRVGALDRPKEYKTHEKPIPFLGGLAILAEIRAVDFDVWTTRPTVAKMDKLRILFEGWWRDKRGTLIGSQP